MDNGQNKTTVTHRGIALTVTECCIGVAFHGRAASHTGYFSETSIKIHQSRHIQKRARLMIDHYLEAPYLVGQHDQESWRAIYDDVDGLRIRVPDFHRWIIVNELLKIGFRYICDLNHFIHAPAHMDRNDLSAVLAPLLEPGSRSTDEAQLAGKLQHAYAATGIELRESQLGLF